MGLLPMFLSVHVLCVCFPLSLYKCRLQRKCPSLSRLNKHKATSESDKYYLFSNTYYLYILQKNTSISS